MYQDIAHIYFTIISESENFSGCWTIWHLFQQDPFNMSLIFQQRRALPKSHNANFFLSKARQNFAFMCRIQRPARKYYAKMTRQNVGNYPKYHQKIITQGQNTVLWHSPASGGRAIGSRIWQRTQILLAAYEKLLKHTLLSIMAPSAQVLLWCQGIS